MKNVNLSQTPGASKAAPRQLSFMIKASVLCLAQLVLSIGFLNAQNPNLPPSGNFELIDWKITLPDQVEVKEQELSSGFESPNEFYTDPSTGAMVFRCPNNGATGGSTYPRSELREMLRAGNTSISTTGIGLNNWVFSTSSQSNQDASGGVDGTLTATVAVDHVSTSGNSSMIGRVIIGQIHAANDEPCRLYYRKLPGNTKGSIYLAHEPGNGGSEQWYDMIGSRSSSASDPADGIALGEQFSYEIKAEGNTLTVTIMRTGKADVQEIVDMSNSGFANDWMYFKAGCYNQNNSGNSGDYAQVSFFALSNSHTTNGNNEPTSSITSPSNGANFTPGANITITANASDSDGSITKVEFFQGATKLGEDSSSPYSYTWNNVAAGNYNLTSVATDDQGATGTSTVVAISVSTAPPVESNVALNKPVTGTGTPDGSNVESNLVDGDPDSRWSVSGYPQSATVDLGAVFSIESTEVICYNDRAYQYIIEASTNGSSYSTIVDRSSNTTPGTNTSPITDSFSPVDARYVRITVSGAASYSGSWVSLEELRVFGEEGTNVPVTGVTVTPASATLVEGNTQQLSASVSPSNATDQGISYSSSNTSVATVNSSGLVTAVSAGNATITVTTDDGGFTDTSTITVQAGGGGSWTVISSEDFESGWGIWNDGGSDAKRYTGGTHAHQGSAALDIENNSSSSVVTTDNLSLASYADLKVDFWFKPVGMDNGHDFWLQISTDGGSNYTTVESWVIDGSNYINNSFYQESVELPGYGLNDQTRVRFRCDANDDGNDIYLDEIVISARTSSSSRLAAPLANTSEIENLKSELSVYPNPMQNRVTIDLRDASQYSRLEIIDMAGKMVLIKDKMESDKVTLDVDALSKGVFILKLYRLDHSIETIRLIK